MQSFDPQIAGPSPKQGCPLKIEPINKLWHSRTTENHKGIRMHNLPLHSTVQMCFTQNAKRKDPDIKGCTLCNSCIMQGCTKAGGTQLYG